MPDLRAVAQDVERVLTLEHLLHQVRHHVAHRQLDVAAEDLDVAQGPALADADAVEGPHDRVGQPVLLVGGLGEVLDRQLLEPVGRQRRRDLALLALGGRPRRSADSKTIDEDRYVTFCSCPGRWASMAASHDAAMMRSLVASRS